MPHRNSRRHSRKSASVAPQLKVVNSRDLYSMSLSKLKEHPEFYGDVNFKPAPFQIKWVHGYNQRAGAINLNDRGSTCVFYAASNYGVVYNWTENTMKILQGHRHMVTCIAADLTGRWLATGDTGSEDMIIIWDATDFFPQRTIFKPHQNLKLARIAMSGDAKYMLTLAYGEKPQLYWWIWSFGLNVPHAKIEPPISNDLVVAMEFNPYNSEQFLLLTQADIHIGVSEELVLYERGVLKKTDNHILKMRCVEKGTQMDVGRLTCFTFVQDTSQILVGCSRGGILVYGYTMEYNRAVQSTDYELLRFIKVLKVDRYRINTIYSIDGNIVTGNSNGEIHFFDDHVKLLYWVHGFQVDSIKGISFNISPRMDDFSDLKYDEPCVIWDTLKPRKGGQKDKKNTPVCQRLVKLPRDATTTAKPFLVRDFIVCTYNQGIGYVNFLAEKITTILDYKISPALTMSLHPEKPFLCIGYQDGNVELFNIDKHKLFKRFSLREYYKVVIPPKEDSIKLEPEITVPVIWATCLKHSPSGLHLACGLSTGGLIFLDPSTMDIITPTPLKDTKYAIKEINYSEDSLTLVFSDFGRTICVYKYDCAELKWHFVCKHRAHYKDVNSVFFTPEKNEDGEYKLLSLGKDRIMVEYDVGASSNEYLEILSLDRVEQSAEPLCGIVWPTPKSVDPEHCRTDLPLILIANDEYKYKIINYETTMTLATVLGPRYDYPVNRLKLISRKEGDEELEYLLYSTKNIIGLQKMPLDGNPWKHVAQLGHHNQLTELCFREDINKLFTMGSKDNCVCEWTADYKSVESTTKQGGGDLDPYYCIIEDGRPGWLFQEIRDLFYYIQILCQGTFSPAQRGVKDFIPISSLPDMIRALGFFPSEYEVENLIVEAKFKIYQKEPSTEIDFEEFVKLYLNHRPAFGDNYRRIRAAFKTFAKSRNEELSMDRESFLEMLSEYGERFPSQLTFYLLSILSGHSFEDRAQMSEDDFSFLPEKIDLNYLLSHIMGIRDVEAMAEQISIDDSNSVVSRGSTEVSEVDYKFF